MELTKQKLKLLQIEQTKAHSKLEQEIRFLQNRKSNIPKHNSDIRDKIAQELKIELPFVGELEALFAFKEQIGDMMGMDT